jgi:hypothetical protein
MPMTTNHTETMNTSAVVVMATPLLKWIHVVLRKGGRHQLPPLVMKRRR